MNKSNRNKIAIGILISSILFLILIHNISISYAQNEEETINLPQNFTLEEFSENSGTQENVTSIDIDLGSSRWNVTDIDLNFTDIKLERETKPIEDSEEGEQTHTIVKNHPIFYTIGLGVEIYLSELTTIYGIYIYGYKQSTTEQVYLQIREYNDATDEPGSYIHHNHTLNISEIPGWYFQNFSSSISLPSGKYYLVLFNEFYSSSAKHFWSYTTTPNNSSLHTSEYDSISGWINVKEGEPFLYKLVQKVNKSYDPIDIEMGVVVDGTKYNLTNGPVSGSGNVSIPNINFSPNDDILNIPIKTNESLIEKLNFTLSYHINLKNNLIANGNVTIRESFIDNEWVVHPQLLRTNGNYSIQFESPQSWKHRRVFRNTGSGWDNVTDEVIMNNNFIFISNNTIKPGSDWRITANSTKIDFTLDVTLPASFKAGENLQFSLITPCLVGDYTFILYNSKGILEIRNTTNCDNPSAPPIFSYSLPSDSVSGEWTAYVFWNNKSGAGVQSQIFTISGGITIISGGGGGGGGGGSSTTVTGLDPLLVLIVSIIIIAAIAGSLTSYQMVKAFKRKRDLKMIMLRNKVMDSLNLNYIMISENSSGLNVYEQFFGGKSIDPTLISGFLSAIRSFGIEITGTFEQSQTIKLDFQNSKILMNEFRNFRLILIMGENPSDDFIESIRNLSHDIEREYGELIRGFDGKLDEFKGIGKLIERNLNVSFIFPLKVVPSKEVKLTPAEKSVLSKAREIMKQNNLSHIFTSFLMDDQTYDPKRIRAIFELIDKGIFQPIRLESENPKQ